MTTTPLPWAVEIPTGSKSVTIRQGKQPIAELWHNGDDPKANADLVVRAVNNHAALVKALIDTLNMLRAAHIQCGVHHGGIKRVIAARAVLAAAQATDAGQSAITPGKAPK